MPWVPRRFWGAFKELLKVLVKASKALKIPFKTSQMAVERRGEVSGELEPLSGFPENTFSILPGTQPRNPKSDSSSKMGGGLGLEGLLNVF